MQRVYSLVRAYELGRVDGFTFDFVVRLRPDQPLKAPFPTALSVSVGAWPEESRSLAPAVARFASLNWRPQRQSACWSEIFRVFILTG